MLQRRIVECILLVFLYNLVQLGQHLLEIISQLLLSQDVLEIIEAVSQVMEIGSDVLVPIIEQLCTSKQCDCCLN